MKTIKQTLSYLHGRQQMLMLLAAFCISLLIVRATLTQSLFFFFLIWNLFLAYLPLGITSILTNKVEWIEKKLYFYPLSLCWLLVLPNAPYIITDFVHLQRELDVPVWFDVLLLISFTVTGLLFGLASMRHMFYILAAQYGGTISKVVILVVCLLSAYGIYLGRYLRYNSWDILHRPLNLFNAIIESLINPAYYKASLGITIGFGTLFYLLFSLYNDNNKKVL